MIPIGQTGVIRAGQFNGYKIRIDEDDKEGGFFVQVRAEWGSHHPRDVSTWIESFDALHTFVRDVAPEIDW